MGVDLLSSRAHSRANSPRWRGTITSPECCSGNRSQRADRGSVAAGGDIIDGPITLSTVRSPSASTRKAFEEFSTPTAANPGECRRFSHTWKSHRRDRAGWVGREDSNLGMAESKSTCSAFPFNGHFEKTEKFAPFPINRLAPMSECVVRASRALSRFLFHRRYRRAPASLGCSRRRHGRVWVVTSRCIVRSRMGRLSARRWSDHHDRYPASDRTGRWRRS